MIAVPFIYFSLLALHFWRQSKTVGIGVLLALLYAVSGFFSILADWRNLYGVGLVASPEDITVIPTLLYCSLITLLILPFQKIAKRPPDCIVVEDEPLFNAIALFYMLMLGLAVFLMFKGVSHVLQGDLQEMKIASRSAGSVAATSRRGVAFMAYFIDFSFFLVPFFFASLCCLRRKLIFTVPLLGASLTRVFIALVNVDRSRLLFWIYMMGFSLVFFKPFFSPRQKRGLFLGGLAIGFLVFSYFAAVTIARFHFRVAGTSGGVIAYAGESFIHFCHFYHNYPPVYSLYRIFPLFYSLTTEDGFTLRWVFSTQTGLDTGIFTSVLGVFYADLGLIGMISMVLFLHGLFRWAIARMGKRTMHFSDVLLLHAMAVVPLWGNISYWYNSRPRMMSLLYCLLIAWGMRFRCSRKTARKGLGVP